MACGEDVSAQARVGDACVLDSDCEGALLCIERRCHEACAQSSDCPPQARCVRGPEGANVCQLDSAPCALNSDCPGAQVCAIDGRLITPADGVLLGITRKSVIELAQSLNVKVEIGALPEETLRRADEIFLSSTAGGVMPVRSLDGVDVGDGSPGPLTTRLRQLYWDAHADRKYATRVRYS